VYSSIKETFDDLDVQECGKITYEVAGHHHEKKNKGGKRF